MRTTRGSRQLTEARRCIERWRRERTSKKEAIPEHVWSAAAAAARADGIWSTSRALRLEFNRLKAEVVGARGKALTQTRSGPAKSTGRCGVVDGRAEIGEPRGPREPAFVEVVLDPAREADPAGAVGKAVIELMGRQGERMRIEIAGSTAVDVLGLSQTFWSRQP
ncbi:MAG: hypothetical protein ACHQ0J_14705 [Candidatus Dormibacterales bacterium]